MKSSELLRKIEKAGWKRIRQTGSHVIMEKDGETISVPYHGTKEVKKGLCEKLLKQAGLK